MVYWLCGKLKMFQLGLTISRKYLLLYHSVGKCNLDLRKMYILLINFICILKCSHLFYYPSWHRITQSILRKILFILAITPQILYLILDGKFDHRIFQMRDERKMLAIEINFEKLGKLKIILWSLTAFNQLKTSLHKILAFSEHLYFSL